LFFGSLFGLPVHLAVLCCRLGSSTSVLSDIDPPWIITVGSSFIGFFAGAYAAVKLGDLALNQK
jgi:hypothetical protein